MIIPTVIEKGHPIDHAYDIYSCLLKERIVFCTRDIDDTLASTVIAQLLYLDSQSHEPIQMYINSNGGSVTAGLAIIDTMNFIKSDVSTICMGMCASMAAMILMCGTRGKRCALSNSTIMIHQPLGNIGGKVTDVESTAQYLIHTKKRMIEMIHDATSQSKKQIEIDIENDKYLSSEEAKKYGILDIILQDSDL